MATVYIGEYMVPGFQGTTTLTASPTPYTANTTNGCLAVILEQPVGGTAGQYRHRYDASPNDNAEAIAEPQFANDPAAMELDGGVVSTFSITNLTTTSGTAAFTLANGTAGSGNITGSETIIIEPDGTVEDRRGRTLMHFRRAMWNKARTRL